MVVGIVYYTNLSVLFGRRHFVDILHVLVVVSSSFYSHSVFSWSSFHLSEVILHVFVIFLLITYIKRCKQMLLAGGPKCTHSPCAQQDSSVTYLCL